MGKVTISDVAREAGVSLGTVSNALNHPDKVRPATMALINQAIAKLGYIPNQAARQLAGSRSHVIGLALPRLDHAFSLQIANGALAEGRTCGYDVLIASAGNDDLLENHYLSYFMGAQMAGVLVQPMTGRSWKPPVETPPIPTVYLDVHSTAIENYVAADNEAQGRLIMEHAVSCGASRVAVIGKAEFTQLSLRVRGICEVARANDVEAELIGRGDWNTAQNGFELGLKLAQRPEEERPDFVIGLTDVLAAGAIEGLRAGGLDVPRDMLVAGCDGNPLAWSGQVPLTTIASPGYEMGRRGVQLLIELISDPSRAITHHEVVVPTLIKRTSTATAPEPFGDPDARNLNLGDYLADAASGDLA